MKRRKFVKKAAVLPLAGSAALVQAQSGSLYENTADDNQIYEWRQYDLNWGKPQKALEDYLKDALIPALNRAGVKQVGVFTEMGMSTPAKLYVLIPHSSFEAFYNSTTQLNQDATYQKAAKDFESRSSGETVYARYHTWLLRAFDGLTKMVVPNTSQDRIFELRTYEGHNDSAVDRKVSMFDIEEIPLFFKVKLNPVFFGEMIAGPAMPALTYMLVFKNMEERDSNWKDFVDHPDWNTMKVKPQYADSVSNIVRIFLKPTGYSQV